MIHDKTVFITGGAGFIGSTLAGRLVEDDRIVIFDNLTRDSLKDKPFRNHPNLRLIEGDVLDPEALARAMAGADIVVHCAAVAGADIVVHCAAVAGIDTVIREPVMTMRVNLVGSANVLEAAARLDHCDRVVCFSTSEVFGQHSFRSAESDATVMGAVGEARWTYAVSKLGEEHLAVAYHQQMGLPTTVVRPFNVYGPGQVGEGALRTFIIRVLADEPIEIHGDGTQIRAWCYIDDMIDGLLLAMTSPQAVGESFNIGNQRAVVTIYGLANTVVRVLGSKSANAVPRRPVRSADRAIVPVPAPRRQHLRRAWPRRRETARPSASALPRARDGPGRQGPDPSRATAVGHRDIPIGCGEPSAGATLAARGATVALSASRPPV